MRWQLARALVLCVLVRAVPAYAGPTFTATLTGDQEDPPVMTTAHGQATLNLSDDEQSLTIRARIFGVDPNATGTRMHIHSEPAGGVVFGFISPNHDQDGDLIITPETDGFSLFGVWDGNEGNGTTLPQQLENLKNQKLYLNVHTAAFPGGEIRGQIVPEPTSLVLLTGAGLMLIQRRKGC